MRIQEIFALLIMLFLVVMCNTKRENHRALFVKICEVDSCSKISCEIYFFEKIDTSQDYSKNVLDSVISKRERNFLGKSAENLPYLHYLQKDTISFIINKEHE